MKKSRHRLLSLITGAAIAVGGLGILPENTGLPVLVTPVGAYDSITYIGADGKTVTVSDYDEVNDDGNDYWPSDSDSEPETYVVTESVTFDSRA